ncbi:potassium channel family protein [Methanoculleus taiwanensis]|uniref:potassium channel family protein n=1 Tax=Methanoculleus taiwanensis TaxID=1550565 RepID=UPI001F4FF12B|nr:potassium channel family protein [Methanoculleus taiwanensis]
MLTSIVLIAGVHAVSDSRRALIVAALFASAALLSGWLYVVTDIPALNVAENAISLIFYTHTTIIILTVVLRSRAITTDTIYGAICVYLLIGLTYANGYTFIETMNPGSFYASAVHEPGGRLAFPDLLYYSFVTMTTLGYGDITPITNQARSLAMLEAVSGVLYVAVLISRLIGSLGRSSGSDGDEEQKK